MKLLVVPADPLSSYLTKGEIKKLYFNPGNIFTQIIFLNFDSVVVNPNDIKYATGIAVVRIVTFAPLNHFEQIFPWLKFVRIKKFIKNVDVDVVRGYSPFFSGYLALKMSKVLGVNNLVSVHSNFIELLKYYWEDRAFFRFLKYFLLSIYIEPLVLRRSSFVQPAYEYAAEYCIQRGCDKGNLRTVYNRVYSSDFFPLERKKISTKKRILRIIAVGNLEKRKGQRVLLEALSQAPFSFKLTLLGKGPDRNVLQQLIQIYGLEKNVELIDSMPNENLRGLYLKHDVFALPIQYGGVCIPALEAAACGLAVIYPRFPLAHKVELIEGFFLSVENTRDGFLKGLSLLATKPDKLDEYKKSSFRGYAAVNSEKMETKEIENYKKLIV